MFTRRHYIATAKLIKGTKNTAERKRLANRFSLMYKKDNKRFDRARFLVASGVKAKAKPKKKVKKKSTLKAYWKRTKATKKRLSGK